MFQEQRLFRFGTPYSNERAVCEGLRPAVFGFSVRRPVLEISGHTRTALAFLVVRLAELRALSGAWLASGRALRALLGLPAAAL